MKNKLSYTFSEDLKDRLNNPKFKKSWEESEIEYMLAKAIIEKRLAKKLSQRDLAQKLNTTQAVISRIETMCGNPSLSLLKRIASALDTKLLLHFSN